MATISYTRPVTINPDWGVKNLLEAMKKGDQLKTLREEDEKMMEMLQRPIPKEVIEETKAKYKDA